MSPRQLKYFLEIYNQRSRKKAAEKLIISPQAVSKTIKEIEEELQVTLFIRGKKSLEPTTEAVFLKNHAVKILEEYENINAIKSFHKRENKILTIYAVDGFLQYVTIKFIELERRDIDTAIITRTLNSELFNHTYLYSNKNCVVINKENPLAKKLTISQTDLDQQPIAGKGMAYSCYSSNVRRLFQRNINPKIKLETTNDSLIINMAERNLAIGITLDYIAFSADSKHVVIRPFEAEQTRNVFWIENNSGVVNKEEHLFSKFLFKWIKEYKLQLFNWDLL